MLDEGDRDGPDISGEDNMLKGFHLSKKQKKWLQRIALGAAGFLILEVLAHTGAFDSGRQWLGFLIALVPYLIVGWDVIRKSIRNISHGDVFDENFLMMIATFGAFGIGEYPEAVAVMLLYQVGEFFQNYATGKSRESISGLMSIAPETACVERDGELEVVDPDEVKVGEIIVVRPGEKIPLDGEVIEGESLLDTSALTGEPVPRRARTGDLVTSGCVNGEGTLKIRTSKCYDDSTVAKILELVESATDKKTRVENFVTRFARIYTPIVTISALVIALIPPLVLGGGTAVWFSWIRRACIFLVVSCPCALVISVPLGFFGGIGAASRIGVLVKGSNYLEALSQVKTIVFDKTGTLTKGEFKVRHIIPASGFDSDSLLELAAYAECYSTHPIAGSIREAYGKNVDISRVSDAAEQAGHGVCALVDGRRVLAGNKKLMDQNQVLVPAPEHSGTVLYLVCDKTYAGMIVISDSVKDGVKEGIREIKAAGVQKTVMLTGDGPEAAGAVASETGIDEVCASLLPDGKVQKVEELLKAARPGQKVAFVGDGINDAPVLMRADVGIAMGLIGSDAAIEAADIVLMDDDVRKIARTVKIARKTLGIIHANIIFAIAVKIAILVLSVLGMANMWMAIFGDVGVLILCILNAMRLLRKDKAN